MKELNHEQAEQVVGARRTRLPITTLALGEEGCSVTTLAIGEEGTSVTTKMIGEEGAVITTLALGEEGGGTSSEAGSALGSF